MITALTLALVATYTLAIVSEGLDLDQLRPFVDVLVLGRVTQTPDLLDHLPTVVSDEIAAGPWVRGSWWSIEEG